VSDSKKVYVGAIVRRGRHRDRVVTSNGSTIAAHDGGKFMWGDQKHETRRLAVAMTVDLLGKEDDVFTAFLLKHILSGLPKHGGWRLTSQEIATYLRRIDYGIFHLNYDAF
jgi:hypothetical protein